MDTKENKQDKKLTKLDLKVLSLLHTQETGSGLLASELASELDGKKPRKIYLILLKLKRHGLVNSFLGIRGNRKQVRLFERI